MDSEKRISALTDHGPLHPFDWMNNTWAYDPQPDEGAYSTAQLNAQSRLAYILAREHVRGGRDVFFWPGPMSTDFLSYQLVLDNADKVKAATKARFGDEFLTVVNVGQYVAPSLVKQYVTLANQAANRQLGARGRSLRPDMAAMVPSDFEATLHSIMHDKALSGGVGWRSWAFERWWVPHVYDCTRFGLGGKHVWSYCGAIEELTAILRQYGLAHDAGEGRPVDIVDWNDEHVPHADQAWERARHVWWLVEKGFRNDLAVATLMVQFQLHDWYHARHPILDLRKMHPSVLHEASVDTERMERLKAIMLPFLAEYAARWMGGHPDADLAAYIQQSVTPHLDQWSLGGRDAHASELYAYQPKAGFDLDAYADIAREAYLNRERQSRVSVKTAPMPTALPRTHAEGPYFGRPARLFDDGLYEDLSEREQGAAKFMAGAGEAIVPAVDASRHMFMAYDVKGGLRAKAFGERHNLPWGREMQGRDDFAAAVIAPNVEERDRLAVWLETRKNVSVQTADGAISLRDKGVLFGSDSLERISGAIERNPAFSPAEGTTRPSSLFRLAAGVEWIDRTAYALVVPQGWEQSNDDAAYVVRACLNALGLVGSPVESKRRQMEIFVAAPKGQGFTLVQQSLPDLTRTAAENVVRLLSLSDVPPARDLYVAAARLLHLSDMVVDQYNANTVREQNTGTGGFNRHAIVDVQRLASEDPHFLRAYIEQSPEIADLRPASQFYGAEPTLYDNAKHLLLERGVLHFTPQDCEGLPPDYLAAWNRLHAQSALQGRAAVYGHAGLRPKGPMPGGAR